MKGSQVRIPLEALEMKTGKPCNIRIFRFFHSSGSMQMLLNCPSGRYAKKFLQMHEVYKAAFTAALRFLHHRKHLFMNLRELVLYGYRHIILAGL